ncbi:hypothetical protein PQ610_05575 [Tardisphaera miroshnichenkoae]
MARKEKQRKRQRQRIRDPLARFSDDELEYLYKFFVENRSVSDIALSRDPALFEKKTLWKYTKNKIYSLIWKLRYLLEQRYGSKLNEDGVDATAAELLKKKLKQATKSRRLGRSARTHCL